MVSKVMQQITTCLDSKDNFVLLGGAGCGKTYTLIQTLHHVFINKPESKVSCITYTNVAADEIKNRSPYSKLFVSTIHDFLWNEIRDYQKNLIDSLIYLINIEKEDEGLGIRYTGDNEINTNTIHKVKYDNYRDLEQGIISHDDLLKISNYMLSEYPLLAKILCDKYDYIFIDEFQDTQKSVIEIFLNHIKQYSDDKVGIGFFGDEMQNIYQSETGMIKQFVNSGEVKEIIKEDNYRCSVAVIELLNNIRTDIKQQPSKILNDGSIGNKEGSALFVYSDDQFNIERFKESEYVSSWNFEDYENTKMLFLTHKLIASRLGFIELLSSYSHNDRLIGNEPDRLALHLLKIGGILYHYKEKNYSYVLDEIDYQVKVNDDKFKLTAFLEKIVKEEDNLTIGHLIELFHNEKLVLQNKNLKEYIEKYTDMYESIMQISMLQVLAYYEYYNSYSPYSTQHGIKGAEFENVLVIMDNGRWNNYNFKSYFEESGKETVIDRTKKIFYVSCSRAKNNLVVYYPKPTQKIILKAKELFGEDNIKKF